MKIILPTPRRGMGTHFLQSLFHPHFHHKIANDYRPFIDDFPTNYKSLDFDSKEMYDIEDYPTEPDPQVAETDNNDRYLLLIRHLDTCEYIRMVGALKDKLIVRCIENYPYPKDFFYNFNKKYGVNINPYSGIVNGYIQDLQYNHNGEVPMDEASFKIHVKQWFEKRIEVLDKEYKEYFKYGKTQEWIDLADERPDVVKVIYYEDIFCEGKTEGTVFEGLEQQLRDHHDLNVSLLSKYRDVFDFDKTYTIENM